MVTPERPSLLAAVSPWAVLGLLDVHLALALVGLLVLIGSPPRCAGRAFLVPPGRGWGVS